MFGRTLKSSIAKDNGRSTEFIQKKNYPDKSQCYECGDEGHLSYTCPKNALGTRDPPPKKERKRKKKMDDQGADFSALDSDDDDSWRTSKPSQATCETDEEDEVEEPDLETLSAVIKMEQEKYSTTTKETTSVKRKRIKKDSYFSDEEELSE